MVAADLTSLGKNFMGYCQIHKLFEFKCRIGRSGGISNGMQIGGSNMNTILKL